MMITAYHGTSQELDALEPGHEQRHSGATEKAVFATASYDEAATYALDARGAGHVYRVAVDTDGFAVVDYEDNQGGHMYEPDRMQAIIDAARADGRPGVIVRGIWEYDGMGREQTTHYVILDSGRAEIIGEEQ